MDVVAAVLMVVVSFVFVGIALDAARYPKKARLVAPTAGNTGFLAFAGMTRLRRGYPNAQEASHVASTIAAANRWLESFGRQAVVLADHLKGENMKALLVACALAIAFATGSTVTAQSYPPDGSTIPAVTLNGSPAIQQPAPKPANQQSAWNTELAGHSDLQGRSAYQPIIINENGRGDRLRRSPHRQNGRTRSPVSSKATELRLSMSPTPRKPKYLAHIPGPAEGGEEAGGAQMVRVCSGSVLRAG